MIDSDFIIYIDLPCRARRRLPDPFHLAHAAGWELYDLHGLDLHCTDPAQHLIRQGEDLDLDRDLYICTPKHARKYARFKLRRRMAKHGDTLRVTREEK